MRKEKLVKFLKRTENMKKVARFALAASCLYGGLCSAAEEIEVPFYDISQAFDALTVFNIQDLSKEQGTFRLRDGSLWKILKTDDKVELSWQNGDRVKFMIEEGWYYPASWVFFNLRTDEKLPACLLESPTDHKLKHCNWITFLDTANNVIFLQNGMRFALYPQDMSFFKKWQDGDFLIMGDYSSIFSSYNYILFNCRTQTYIFAKYQE